MTSILSSLDALQIITDIETKLGIYYESTGVNNQDSLYVSFGLFNDLFLNTGKVKRPL